MADVELIVNHVYRAKRPAQTLHGFFNDRQILWIGERQVQYDSPTVSNGRHYPKMDKEQFLKWAGEDVTAEMPKNEWMNWIPASERKKT